MAQYIGQAPINGFHAKQSLTGDGSTTAFTLDQTVASETSMIVSVGGVLQEPKVAYNLTIGGTKIDFTEAPSSTDTVYVQFLGKAIVQNIQDLAGTEFVLMMMVIHPLLLILMTRLISKLVVQTEVQSRQQDFIT